MPRNKIKNSGRYRFSVCILIFCIQVCVSYSFAEEGSVYNAEGRRNPFIPLVTSDGRFLKLEREEGVSGLLLEGMIYDEHGTSYAVVNGEVVRVGDDVSGYQVLKIEKNRVIFAKGGEMIEVELKEEEP